MVTINGTNDLVRMIKCGETSKVQFKQKLSSQKQIADEMIAFANSRGGVIIFGVEDKTGTIVGLDYEEIQEISRDLGNAQYKDSRDLDGTIPEQFDQAMKFLDNNLHHIQAGQSFNSLGILEVSRIALEEILQNAQVHREYIKTAPIRLLIFANRIEIISPGCLPGNMTVEGIQLGETFQRNPLLASFCAKTMVYRGLGSGIVRAKKDGAKIEFRNDEETNQFITTIWRTQLAEKSASLSEKSASLAEKGPSLNKKGLSSNKKGLSSGKKGLSSGKKGLSSGEKGLSKKNQIIERLLEYCEVPRGLSEISEFLEMSNKTKLRNNYIYPLLGSRLAMTFPNSPKSPTQKYYTIHKD